MLISYRLLTRVFCSVLVVLPTASVRCESPERDRESAKVEAHVERGYKYIRRERFPKAIDELELAQELSRSPCIRCLEGIGLSYYRSKMFEDAVRAYEELFEATPGVLSVLWRLVQLYDRVGSPEKSVAAYKAFLENADEPGEMITIYNEFGVRSLTPGSGLTVDRNASAVAFRAALDLAGGRSNLLRRNLAEALWQLGAKEDAFGVLEGLMAEDAKSWGLLPALERTSELLEKDRSVRSTWDTPVLSEPRLSMEAFVENRLCSLGSGLGEAITVEGEVHKPEKLSAPQPQYPPAARGKRIQGVVVVGTIIDELGCVRATQVLKGLSADMNEEAVRAIRQWRFRPATLKGEPVAVYYNLTVNYRLQ